MKHDDKLRKILNDSGHKALSQRLNDIPLMVLADQDSDDDPMKLQNLTVEEFCNLLPFEEFLVHNPDHNSFLYLRKESELHQWFCARFVVPDKAQMNRAAQGYLKGESFELSAMQAIIKKSMPKLLAGIGACGIEDTDKGLLIKVAVSKLAITNKGKSEETLAEQLEAEGEYHDFCNEVMVDIAKVIMALDHMEETSQYLVEVEKKAPRAKGNQQKSNGKKYTRTHHYIYLDKPTVASENSELVGTRGGRKCGHPRRAHWKTLRSERFKNHPMYLHRIRIKATWVGPKRWSDDQAIYTLKGV